MANLICFPPRRGEDTKVPGCAGVMNNLFMTGSNEIQTKTQESMTSGGQEGVLQGANVTVV